MIEEKPFALFSGDYNPRGGWWDFIGVFPTIEEAVAAIPGKKLFTWYHVIDLRNGEVAQATGDSLYGDSEDFPTPYGADENVDLQSFLWLVGIIIGLIAGFLCVYFMR